MTRAVVFAAALALLASPAPVDAAFLHVATARRVIADDLESVQASVSAVVVVDPCRHRSATRVWCRYVVSDGGLSVDGEAVAFILRRRVHIDYGTVSLAPDW